MRLRQIHLELSSKCNARCPMCARTHQGRLWPQIPQDDLSLEKLQKILSPEILNSVELVYISGVYGEPTLNTRLLDILEWALSAAPQLRMTIDTNASTRTPDWWRLLGEISLRHGLRLNVRFSIDGLRETNALYRVGTSWDKIIENATAYINAGGFASWIYLVFAHNEHQLEDARKTADAMGFKQFQIKKTQKFKGEAQFDAHNPRAEITHTLRPPSSNELKHSNLKQAPPTQLLKSRINCKALMSSEVYISSEGYVFPCCWLGTIYGDHNLSQKQFLKRLDEYGGLPALDGSIHGLEAILKGRAYNELIAASWDAPDSDKLKTCLKTCQQKQAQHTEACRHTLGHGWRSRWAQARELFRLRA